MPEYLYRYEALHGEYEYDAKLILQRYRILKETPKGCWVENYTQNGRWVSNTSRKRFAHRTTEEAREAYRYRKRSYLGHAKATVRRAEMELGLADDEVNSSSLRIKLRRFL
jgi:hypothetical protein